MTLRPRLIPLLMLTALSACVGEKSRKPVVAPAPPPVAPTPAPAPSPAPSGWRSATVVPDAVDVPASIYVVKPGDSLRAIAVKTGAGSEAIARANKLSPPFTIFPKQKLKIPGGRYHLVRQGQNGIAIARAYGVAWTNVVALNDLQEPYILRTGQRILLPSKAQVAAMSLEERAAAFTLNIDDLITGSEPALAANQDLPKPAPPPTRPLAPTPARPAPGNPATPSTKPTAPAGPATTPPASPAPTSPAVPVTPPQALAGTFGWPLEGRLIARFGPMGQGRVSNGLNIAASEGTPIRAAADGVVAYVGSDIPAMGNLVLLRHADGWITAYAHAESTQVTRGQTVRRGQVIGKAGSTGSVDEPQLHFELRKARGAVDPLLYLPKRT